MKKFLPASLLLAVVSCGHTTTDQELAQNDKPEKVEWITLDYPDFSIQYPETWELNDADSLLADFYLISPNESNKDLFRECVSLSTQDLTGQGVSLDQYVTSTIEQIETYLKNTQVIENERIETDTETYHKIIYTTDNSQFNQTIEQLSWIFHDKLYVLSFVSETKSFKKFQETGETILESFTLKEIVSE